MFYSLDFCPAMAYTGFKTETGTQNRDMNNAITIIRLQPDYDAALAAIIRNRLDEHGLNIPGTAYFDESLDHLSRYYDQPGRAYFVLLKDEKVIGGVGLAAFSGFPDCCEMQKLYLTKEESGKGLGMRMVRELENAAEKMGFRRIYLETHTNLQAAIRLYEKAGYRRIERPESVVHSTMNRFYLKEIGT